MLKPSSKRKRTREEMTEVKDEELQLKEDKQMYLLETKRLKTKTSELNEEVQELKQYKEVVD